jgi:hypothetical protein
MALRKESQSRIDIGSQHESDGKNLIAVFRTAGALNNGLTSRK